MVLPRELSQHNSVGFNRWPLLDSMCLYLRNELSLQMNSTNEWLKNDWFSNGAKATDAHWHDCFPFSSCSIAFEFLLVCSFCSVLLSWRPPTPVGGCSTSVVFLSRWSCYCSSLSLRGVFNCDPFLSFSRSRSLWLLLAVSFYLGSFLFYYTPRRVDESNIRKDHREITKKKKWGGGGEQTHSGLWPTVGLRCAYTHIVVNDKKNAMKGKKRIEKKKSGEAD